MLDLFWTYLPTLIVITLAVIALGKPLDFYFHPAASGKRWFRRIRWKGSSLLVVTVSLTFVYALLQSSDSDRRDREISNLTRASGQIENAVAKVRRIAKASADTIAEQTKALDDQRRSLADSANKLQGIELSADYLVNANIHMMGIDLALMKDENIQQQTLLSGQMAYGALDLTLESIAANAENEQSPTNRPEEHQRQVVLLLEQLDIAHVHEQLQPSIKDAPPERQNDLAKLRDSVLEDLENLRTNQRDLLGLRVAIFKLRRTMKLYDEKLRFIILETRSGQIDANLSLVNKFIDEQKNK
jgi:hypothetical protein